MDTRIWKQLLEEGFISTEEYGEAVQNGKVDEYKLSQPGTSFSYFLRGNLTGGITTKWVRKNVFPPLGIETDYKIFSKFGYSYYGIREGWHLYSDGEHMPYRFCAPIEKATQEELWQITAISMTYWHIREME